MGDLASLRAFLSGRQTRGTSLTAQLDARHDTEKRHTLLTWAARHGQAEAARLLLEGGASVGATNGGGASALYIACQKGHLEIARLLLEASAAVNQATARGATPLFIACEYDAARRWRLACPPHIRSPQPRRRRQTRRRRTRPWQRPGQPR